MTTRYETEVLICGAGAAGLTLAIDLARRGISFRLIEKMNDPFPGSRGKGIQPRSQEIFEDLGILDRLVAAGGLYPIPREYHPDGSFSESALFEPSEPNGAEPFHIPLMVPQFTTERVMRERLTELGHGPVVGCELISFEQDEDGVTARLARTSGDEVIRVRYLVGTDGGRSFVRKALGIDFPGKTLGVRAVVADVTLTGFGRDAWHRFNDGDMERQISLCPLAGTELFQLQAPVPLEGDVDLSEDGLTTMLTERSGRKDARVHAVPWATAYTMNARLADHYRVGRVFLAGDAAHTHPPTGGQGLNTSVQDAYNLGWKLAAVLAARAPAALLDTYEEERRPIAAAMLGLATKLLDAAKRGDARRDREVQQLDIGYADSPLALDAPQRHGRVVAGDRAPDAPLQGSAGKTRRLFELFAGSHWTLLAFNAERKLIAPRAGLHIHHIGAGGDLADSDGYFEGGYAPESGQWWLVRPDGYIGAVVSSAHVERLEGYFAKVGLVGES
jgi:2-polyprenyl-6-methoxyphenol hydroxylase-like FAD-dependent oxidoreductase